MLHHLYGTLPCVVRSSNTCSSFKSTVQSHLQTMYYIYIYAAFVFNQFLAVCFIELLMFYCKMY